MLNYFNKSLVLTNLVTTPLLAFFTAELAKSNQHAVQISKIPININEIQSDSFIISNKNGRKFSCSLPEMQEDEEELTSSSLSSSSSSVTSPPIENSEPQSEAIPSLNQDDQTRESQSTDEKSKSTTSITETYIKSINKYDRLAKSIPGAILPRYKNTPDEVFVEEEFPRSDCIYHTANGDWWSYEICLNQYIRQFHWGQEGVPKQITVIGVFEQDFDWDRDPDDDQFSSLDTSKKAKLHREKSKDYDRFFDRNVHLQYYNSGDICDVTQKPRNAKLIFKCVDRTWRDHKVLKLQEPSTCSYEITIHSPGICATLPEYAVPSDSDGKKINVNQVIIQCNKILSEEEYLQWSEIQDNNRKEQESKSNDLLADFFEQTKQMAEERYGAEGSISHSGQNPSLQATTRQANPTSEKLHQNSPQKSGLQNLKSQLTAKGIEALSNFVSKSFNHAVAEDVDDMEVILTGGVEMSDEEIRNLKETIKKNKRKTDPNFGSKSNVENASEDNTNKPTGTKPTPDQKTNKLDLSKELEQIEKNKYNDDAGQDSALKTENKMKFVDGNNEDVSMQGEGENRISDQLKALQKAIEKDLKDNEDVEGESKLAGLTNIKIQLMDENGEVHPTQDLSVEKLPEAVLQQIKQALMQAISTEKPEKGKAAETEFGELSSSYNEDIDIFDGSGNDVGRIGHDEL